MRLILGLVCVVGGLWLIRWLLRRRRFEGESPVTERWRADHEYRRDGDDRQWK
jgi:hypothetical protein